MSVRITPARGTRGGWEYDIRITWPEGGRIRERGKCPLSGKDASRRWAVQREQAIVAEGKAAYVGLSAASARPATPPPSSGVTLDEFWPRVVVEHYKANRKKPSSIDAAESIYRNHLGPALGPKAIVDISAADIAALKGVLATKAPHTVNNILSILSRSLRCAAEWGVIATVPCKFGLLKVADGQRDWYELPEYQRLVEAAGRCGRDRKILVLLAGSAGLRRGEIVALKWTDIDFARRILHVDRATWRRIEGTPKGHHGRAVPMTDELVDELKAHRHLRERVLYSEKGRELSNRTIRNWMSQCQRRANLEANGGIHFLRHTFCSHLAIAGAPAKAIQELAGHSDLKTTQRYMHLSPGNRSAAMGLLASYQASCIDPDAVPSTDQWVAMGAQGPSSPTHVAIRPI